MMNLIKKLNDYLFYLKYEKNPKKLETAYDIKDFFGYQQFDLKSIKPIIKFINKNFNYIEKINPKEIIKTDSGFYGLVFITKNKDLVIKIETPMGSTSTSHVRMFEKFKKYNFPFVKKIKHIEYLKSHNLILTITKKYYPLDEHIYGQQLQMLISSIDPIMSEYYGITPFNNNTINSKSRLDKYISKNAPLFLNKRELDLFFDFKDGILKDEYNQLLTIYLTFMKHNIRYSDLHKNNIMLDKDKKTLIVIDF